METGITETGNGAIVDTTKLPELGGRELSAQDILIPKMLLCQPTSTFSDDVPQGNFAKSTDADVDLGSKVTLIPLSMYRTWVVFDVSGGKPQYVRTEPCTMVNEKLDWNFEEDGVPHRRDMNINFYCLVPQDIDRELLALESDDPDPDDALLPVVASFSRTSIKTGRVMSTHFAKIDKFRRANPKVSLYPSAFTFKSELHKSDDGKWYTWEVEDKVKSSVAHRATCAEWHRTINTQNVEVHDVDASNTSSESNTLDDVPF